MDPKIPRRHRLAISNPTPHNIPEEYLSLYARSFHKAAKSLAESVLLDANPRDYIDACPIVVMYRDAVELYLKAIVLGEGRNFLATKPDPVSVYKTHSASWLAQFVCQIVTALKWENEFKFEGIENLADFKATVDEVNSVAPGSYAFRLPGETEAKGALDVRGFASRMDALLGLLDSTADGLAAEWDLRAAAIEDEWRGGGFDPTIQ
jgi:hypothetical protein